MNSKLADKIIKQVEDGFYVTHKNGMDLLKLHLMELTDNSVREETEELKDEITNLEEQLHDH